MSKGAHEARAWTGRVTITERLAWRCDCEACTRQPRAVRRLGHGEEARDTMRVALRMPWWTLREGFHACAEEAGVADKVRRGR